jgi:hypothetical protein
VCASRNLSWPNPPQLPPTGAPWRTYDQGSGPNKEKKAICATCHVYVRRAYLDGLPSISAAEEEMLETTASPRDPARSRLGCQLTAGDHFDEIEVDLPAEQD